MCRLIVRATGTRSSESDGWRLNLEIDQGGRRLDGLQVAKDAVDAWRKAVPGWRLVSGRSARPRP
jgi:hypothetical protein